jgi:hypothetical protein
MRFAAALFAALAVASCAFDSEEALFSANEAVFPFETGAAYNWRPSGEGEEPLIVRFQRAGVHYELRVIDAEPDDRATSWPPWPSCRPPCWSIEWRPRRQLARESTRAGHRVVVKGKVFA